MGRVWERGLFASALLTVAPAALVVALGFIVGGPALGLAFVGAVSLMIPLVAALVWWRARRRRLGREPAPAPLDPRAPVPVPSAKDVADLPRPVTACAACGYLGIRFPGIGDGLWPGGGETGGRFVCPRCAWQGIPAEFDSGDDYVAFVRGLHAEASA